MADEILEVFNKRSADMGRAALLVITSLGPMPASERLSLAAETCYSVGLEIGLAIAITDIVAGKQFQAWLAARTTLLVPRAREARDLEAAEFLRVLR